MSKVIKTDLFQKWFDDLKNKMLRTIIKDKTDRIAVDGYLGKTKPIVGAKGISEIKIEMGAGYRIYFNVYIENDEVWLLSGGDKSTQSKDIEAAKELLQTIQEGRGAKR
ncbi:MAG: type II toxin-antitoxin system RelE/ParE family toxin [Campylobacteraceae bacterium]|jgi:putative addiction module killer protein|nr:type II toxin-antitoxin system RelE/ParE family toxin [Campylobacteraceae bacterium]